MEIEGSNQDSQNEEGASRKKSFPARSHDFRIDADPFLKNITSNNIYPGEWFELEAETLYNYTPDSIFSRNSSPVFAEHMGGMSGIRNSVSRQEGASDVKTTGKSETSRGTILVVSQDPVFSSSLQSILGDLGYRVVPAEVYGYGLMRVLYEITPNLAIIDIGMPSMEGISTTLLVRTHTAIPTILLTKWQTGFNTFRMLDVNSPDALSEPITSDELVKMVDRVKMWHQDINL